MNIDRIITDLKNYCSDENNKSSKNVFKTMQKQLDDGNIGIMINEFIDKNEYEGYLYIKKEEEIACPLLYKKFFNSVDAVGYFNELSDMIANKSIDYIVACCKSQN